MYSVSLGGRLNFKKSDVEEPSELHNHALQELVVLRKNNQHERTVKSNQLLVALD